MPTPKRKTRKRNEETSSRVAKIAGKVLRELTHAPDLSPLSFRLSRIVWCDTKITVADIRTLAASCLTQAPDKRKASR